MVFHTAFTSQQIQKLLRVMLQMDHSPEFTNPLKARKVQTILPFAGNAKTREPNSANESLLICQVTKRNNENCILIIQVHTNFILYVLQKRFSHILIISKANQDKKKSNELEPQA